MSTRAEQFDRPAGKVHPATLKLTWSNSDATFKIYNKNTRATTLASLPMRFMVIDNYNTITGWCEKNECSYYSNEVKNINKDILTVKAGGATIAAGLYPVIKENLAAMGAKYAESIYVMFEDGTIGNIIMQGSNCAAWFTFKAEVKGKIVKQWVGIGNPQKQKKGNITWSLPEIKLLDPISDDDAARADGGYEAIQDYKAGITTSNNTPTGNTELSLQEILLNRPSAHSEYNDLDDCDMGY